jgi:hypothetical protein
MTDLWKFLSAYFQANKKLCICRGSLILLLFFGEYFYGSAIGDVCMLLVGIVLFLSPQKEEVQHVSSQRRYS